MTDSAGPFSKPSRQRIVANALDAVEAVKSRRLRDVGRIEKHYRRLGITEMSPEAARGALAEMRRHVASIVEQARRFEGRSYSTWNGQTVPETESHYGQWMTRQVIGYANRYEEEIIRRVTGLGKPGRIVEELFRIAEEEDFLEDSLADGPEGIAGYEAKILLHYALPIEERRELIRELELRFDLRDVAPVDEIESVARNLAGSPEGCSVIMDGYFFGALRSNAKHLIHGPLESSGEAHGVGIDCSTFVQETYEHAGYSANLFKSPISTGSMINREMPGLQDGTFEVERLHSEKDLEPGDAILWSGHVQIYLGRDEQGRVRIAEAVGRRFKTLRESSLPLLETNGIPVFDNPARPMYVFRPR